MSQIRLKKITTLRLIQVTFICGDGLLSFVFITHQHIKLTIPLVWNRVLYWIYNVGLHNIIILIQKLFCHILTCHCDQKLLIKAKTITQQVKNIMMVSMTMKLNNIAGMPFNKTTKTNNTVVYEHLHILLSCIHFYYVLFLNDRCSKFLFFTCDSPTNRINEGIRCVVKFYYFHIGLFFIWKPNVLPPS